MDFPEEDLTEMPLEEICETLQRAETAVRGLIGTYRTGHAIAEGVPTVICGRPNVGKSAFYNRLVGREAAIVTDIAGTTRDVLTDTVTLGKVTLRLSDTAGLRESDDPVERIGVERAKAALAEAELVLVLTDSRGDDPETEALTQSLTREGRTLIRVLTKSDLSAPSALPMDGIPTVALSSVTGEGFDALTLAVESAFIDRDLRMGEEAVVFSARQVVALRETAACIATALENLEAGLPYDICAGDVRAAMGELGMLCGREMRQEVLDEIFSRFCVGK